MRYDRGTFNRRVWRRAPFVSVVLLSLSGATATRAQIDHRVDYRANGPLGRLYDANPRVGSGGYNAPAANRLIYPNGYGVYANQIVTGNVTGLAGFRGLSVIPGTNEFRGGLQSNTLAGFRAQSVNFEQARSGANFQRSGYYDPSSSIADFGAIRLGLNQPGSSEFLSPRTQIPLNIGVQTRERLLGLDQTTIARSPTGEPREEWPTGRVTQRVVAPPGSSSPLSSTTYQDPYAAAMQSTLFGTPQAGVDGPSALGRDAAGGAPDDWTPYLRRDALLGLADETVAPSNDPLRPAATGSEPEIGRLPYEALVQGIGIEQRAVTPSAGAGDDLFERMASAIRAADDEGTIEGFGVRAKRDGERPGGPLSGLVIGGANEPTTDDAGRDRKTDERPTGERAASEPPSEIDLTKEWAQAMIRTPVRTFGIGGDTAVARYLRAGEAALKAGEFIEAAAQFDLATTVAPENPLPYFGRGHAYIASGQYRSAVASLEIGIRMFPQIAAFELDLQSLVGQQDVFDRRRADLEMILEGNEQYELRFLLGYIELYSGLHFDGLNDLETAAKHAPAGSVIAKFPDLLLGRASMQDGDRDE